MYAQYLILKLFFILSMSETPNQPSSPKQISLFSPVSTSHINPNLTAPSSKQRTLYNFQKPSLLSLQRNHSHHEVLNLMAPFSPKVQKSACESSSPLITDRYIPSRKLLRNSSLHTKQTLPDYNNENRDGNTANCCNLNVSEVYRKYVMMDNKKDSQDPEIQMFKNTNILKYLHKPESLNPEIPNLTKASHFDFTQQLANTKISKRKINKLPFKVLDAPALQDDYYLNLIDWSTQNMLGVGLSSTVYLWNANNSKVNKLCDLGMSDTVTSVSWAPTNPHLSIGTNNGEVQIWDVNKMKRIRIMYGHSNRVGAAAWSSKILTTGSRDKTILHRDIRSSSPFVSKLISHKQQVCGLKWSFDEQQLCSGGNDNKLLIWVPESSEPVLKFCDHNAAVKAMAWSPHQHCLLVSGGGTADRTIKFRNTLTGKTTKSVDVGSQVCNLMFSKVLNEIVSTHGYSQNEINIWKYPKMDKISTLTGHSFRVLYLAMSPDGSTIVTGAGGETLRFWNVFPNPNCSNKKGKSLLNMENIMLR